MVKSKKNTGKELIPASVNLPVLPEDRKEKAEVLASFVDNSMLRKAAAYKLLYQDKLYKELNYQTFADCMKGRFNETQATATNYIQALDAVINLEKRGILVDHYNHTVLREIGRVKQDRQAEFHSLMETHIPAKKRIGDVVEKVRRLFESGALKKNPKEEIEKVLKAKKERQAKKSRGKKKALPPAEAEEIVKGLGAPGYTFKYTEKELEIMWRFSLIYNQTIIYPDHFAVMNGNQRTIAAFYRFQEPYDHPPYGIEKLDHFHEHLETADYRLSFQRDQLIIYRPGERGKITYEVFTDHIVAVEDIPTSFDKHDTILSFQLTDAIRDQIYLAQTIKDKYKYLYFSSGKGGLIITRGNKPGDKRRKALQIPIDGENVNYDNLEGRYLYVEYGHMMYDPLDGEYTITIKLPKEKPGVVKMKHKTMNLEYYFGCRVK